jgi:uncharacterized protein
MELEIKHDENTNKFYAIINGKEAHLLYKRANEKILNFYHTYVPEELRGRGIAGKLVIKGFEFAEKNDYKIIPGCSYVGAFLNRHKKFEKLRA